MRLGDHVCQFEIDTSQAHIFHIILNRIKPISNVINWILSLSCRARCSSVVRAFAHSAMGRRIDPLSCKSTNDGSFKYIVTGFFKIILYDRCS